MTVVRGFAFFHLMDQVANGQGVFLIGAEDQRFFLLVDLTHEQVHAIRFALLDLDDSVEIRFLVNLARLDVAFDQPVVRRIDVLIQRR